MKKYITIELDEYIQLLNTSIKMDALEAAGVDNWEGWDMVDEYKELLGIKDYSKSDFKNDPNVTTKK